MAKSNQEETLSRLGGDTLLKLKWNISVAKITKPKKTKQMKGEDDSWFDVPRFDIRLRTSIFGHPFDASIYGVSPDQFNGARGELKHRVAWMVKQFNRVKDISVGEATEELTVSLEG